MSVDFLAARAADDLVMPTISVVIPLYNKCEQLPGTLKSVREQSFAPVETIVIDDGSTDGSAATLPDSDKVFRYIRQQNAGPSAARNRGIAMAHGEFIAFLDADDRWHRDKLLEQASFLAHHPSIDWCACSWRYVAPQRSPVAAHSGLTGGWSIVDDWFDAQVAEDRTLTSGVVVRRSLLDEVGGFDESIRYGQDSDLWVRLALLRPRCGYFGAPLFDYLDVAGSVSTPTRKRTETNARVVIAHLLASEMRGHEGYRRYARRKMLELLRRTVAHGYPDIARWVIAAAPAGVRDQRLMLHAALARFPAGLSRRVATAFRWLAKLRSRSA